MRTLPPFTSEDEIIAIGEGLLAREFAIGALNAVERSLGERLADEGRGFAAGRPKTLRDEVRDRLRVAEAVRVVGGPLHGLEGQVDDSSNPLGIVISVDVLRQGLLLKIPAESLHALP